MKHKQRCLGRMHVFLCFLTITRCRFNCMGDNKLLICHHMSQVKSYDCETCKLLKLLRIIQECFQPKIGRKIRIFSLGRKNNILVKQKSVCRLWLPPSEFPFAERVLVQNVSHENHENHLIFMLMTVQVTYILIPIVSHKADSFCRRGKSKLGIGLFIHELLREPLICLYSVLCLRG